MPSWSGFTDTTFTASPGTTLLEISLGGAEGEDGEEGTDFEGFGNWAEGGDGGDGGGGSQAGASPGTDGGDGGASVHPDLSSAIATSGGSTGDGSLTITEQGITDYQIGTVTNTSVQLTWDDAPNETGYSVEFREQGASSWTVFSTPGADVESETVTGLLDGEQYRLGVVVVGDRSEYADRSAVESALAEPPI